MRVAHIIKVTQISGAERHLLVLLNGLREQGIDAHLIILTEPDNPMQAMMKEAGDRNIPAYRLVIRRHYDLRVLWHLRQTLRMIAPDIVHTHLIHADWFGWFSAKLAGLRTVITSRHNDDRFRYHPALRRASRVLWWLTTGGIAISDSIRDFTIHTEGASAQKIHTVRYGLPYQWSSDEHIKSAQDALRAELNLPDDSIILGMMCRLTEQKGVPFALEAFRNISETFPHVHLVIAGDGELADFLKLQTKTLNLDDNVHWLGWRDDADTIMAGFDIFLLPSLWEGFGLVLLEAMSKRLPVVASAVSAIPEVVAHQETGLLVPPHDSDALADAITTLLNDRPLRKFYGLLGDARLEEYFDVQRMVQETIAVYKRYHSSD